MPDRTQDSPFALILLPAVVTLAITLVRLLGELQEWSPVFFSRQAGGAGAIVGIVWLVPVLGFYFSRVLAARGDAPPAGRLIGHAAAAFALLFAVGGIAGGLLKLEQGPLFGVLFVSHVIAAVIAVRPWPALGQTLFLYGLAARVPVMLVMLFAILGQWGTHYDVLPPGFPPGYGLVETWLVIGFLPQLLLWVPFTVFTGALFGGFALIGRRPA